LVLAIILDPNEVLLLEEVEKKYFTGHNADKHLLFSKLVRVGFHDLGFGINY
jgi:hypothetical protein